MHALEAIVASGQEDQQRLNSIAPDSRAHMPQLDSLRALAFFAVASSHWLVRKVPLANLGGTGVQLFFVLSGFLITGILLDYRSEHESNPALSAGAALRTFYARRFLRIFPLFYGVLIATLILDIGPIRELWPWHAAYASNFLYATRQASPADPFTHFWSLAVEEQFYLVWPFLIFFLPRETLKRLIYILIVVAPIFRLGMENAFPNLHRVNYLPLSCGDSLGVGAYLAFALRNEGLFGAPASMVARRLGLAGLAGGIPVAGLMLIYGRIFPLETVGHFFLVLVFGWLVFHAARGISGPLGRVLNQPQLQFFGKISYGLYVFHHFFSYLSLRPLINWLKLPSYWSENFLVQSFARLTFTVLLAVASWYLYEKPLNNLKRYFTLSGELAKAPLAQTLDLPSEVVPGEPRT